jgi:hypothetical protein
MMAMNVFFAGVPVKNYQAACTWYERLLAARGRRDLLIRQQAAAEL